MVMRMAMNTADRNHITIHNMGEASDLGRSDRVAHSRIMNGSTQKIKLITTADIGFANIVFIMTPSATSSTYSFTIPAAVSAKVHTMKLNTLSSVFFSR
jgi:hypothetical protein